MVAKGKKAEQGEATRGALVAVARKLFAKHGFTGTATEDVVDQASVTRGALYHHFSGKEDLFRAVYEQLESELADRVIAAATAGGNAVEQMRLGLDAFLDSCLEPEVQRICLLEAMAVLGWEAWYEIDERYSLGLLKTGIQSCMDGGFIQTRPVEPLAQVLLGALIQASLAVSRAENPSIARRRFGDEIQNVFAALLVQPQVPARRRLVARR